MDRLACQFFDRICFHDPSNVLFYIEEEVGSFSSHWKVPVHQICDFFCVLAKHFDCMFVSLWYHTNLRWIYRYSPTTQTIEHILSNTLIHPLITHLLTAQHTRTLSRTTARGLQDTLICGEMLLVSVAHLWTFSYRPFTVASQRANLMQVAEALVVWDDDDLSGGEKGGGSAKVG